MNKAEYNEYRRRMHNLTELEYEVSPAYCLQCGKKIAYSQRTKRFCDHSCSASYNNRGVTRNGTRYAGTKLCSCGNPVSERHNKWCDECIRNGVYNKRLYSMSLDEIVTDKSRRLWLIKNRGHQCELCGLTEWRGQPITLELDHIDGNSDNNAADNLRVICPNCHSQTPFWKGSIKGKDGSRQKNRRKRYANGQTW